MNYDFSSQQHQRHENFDPYDVLNIPRDSDLETIKQSFRKLTRVHHPDRNRKNPQYNPAYYSRVCAAYEILSDPRKRMSFDQQHAPTWNVLRDNAKNYPTTAAPQRPPPADISKGKFGESDLKNFNAMFEKSKKANPNDKGYGDQMLGRATEQEVKSGRAAEPVRNVFGSSSSVGEKAFNSRFESELKPKRANQSNGNKNLMERNGEPMGWAVGGSCAAFSEVSVYDGIIVDKERDDFSKTDEATGLNYSDYMSGFETFTEQLPENHHYYEAANKDVERVYNERLSQLTQVPERGHNLSFSQSEAVLNQRREQQLAAEQQRNREYVTKYRDQYASDDLLPAPSRGGGGVPPNAQHQQQQQQQHQNWVGPAQGPPQSLSAPPPQNRQRHDGAINNRMLDRQLDNIRGPPRPF